MADESVKTEATPQADKPVAKVTEADLASAWESTQEQTETPKEVKEEPTVEAKEQEVKEELKEDHQEHELPEEPADNAERSRLGRRLKQMEETQKQLLDEIKSLRGGQPQQVQHQAPENVTYDGNYLNSQLQAQIDAAIERGDIPATVVTPQDSLVVDHFIKNVEAQIVRDANQKFANGYIQTLQSPHLKGDTPDDIHAEVIAELYRAESPFNLKRFGNPQYDAQMNYLEAKNAILLKKVSEKKPESVFKGKPEGSPATGTSVSTRTATVDNDLPELDAAAQDFIKRTGMTAESVKAALKSEMPYYLRGR